VPGLEPEEEQAKRLRELEETRVVNEEYVKTLEKTSEHYYSPSLMLHG
jgi:hypothetical protein